jgi:ubiquinone/menaquinone biosynthesis C-methylase UbiE/uncharacterized protein YbaR (Trm112 family)
MRYSLAAFLACPVCSARLATVITRECASPAAVRSRVESTLVPAAGAIVAPLPAGTQRNGLWSVLSRSAGTPAPPARDYEVEIETGLLVCTGCSRWFPISNQLPELLPDHLRDPERDRQVFEQCTSGLPMELISPLKAAPDAKSVERDSGAAFKRAEIGIRSKVDDPHLFFSPGLSSPFNPHNTTFTLYLIKLFGTAAPLLELGNGDVLLDSGCGYSWTTEWFYKAGVEAIGVDICRTYLEIGIKRMGTDRPHLVVADVEHLPIRDDSADAVFAFESAHHIPDRRKAMSCFSRALKPGGRMVLAEPGAAHEHAQVSVDVMAKYGILEKGMELDDVHDYVAGTRMGKPEQLFVLRASDREIGRTMNRGFIQTHSVVEGNLFRIVRSQPLLDAVKDVWRDPRRVLWPRVKRRLKAALVRFGLE